MNALITGANGGIGREFVEQFTARDDIQQVFATFQRGDAPADSGKVQWHRVNLSDDAEVAALAAHLPALHRVVNAAGLLHRDDHRPEKTISNLDPDWLLDNIRSNTVPSLLLAKHLQNNLRHDQPAVFAAVSARVGSISENALGGWYSYRTAKAALNMSLKTLSIEWRRTLPHVAVAALHPGTVDTPLSEPFQRRVAPEKLFSPERSVRQMIVTLERLTPADSGRFWSWDGAELPW